MEECKMLQFNDNSSKDKLQITKLGLRDYDEELIHLEINNKWDLYLMFKDKDSGKYYIKINNKKLYVDDLYSNYTLPIKV